MPAIERDPSRWMRSPTIIPPTCPLSERPLAPFNLRAQTTGFDVEVLSGSEVTSPCVIFRFFTDNPNVYTRGSTEVTADFAIVAAELLREDGPVTEETFESGEGRVTADSSMNPLAAALRVALCERVDRCRGAIEVATPHYYREIQCHALGTVGLSEALHAIFGDVPMEYPTSDPSS